MEKAGVGDSSVAKRVDLPGVPLEVWRLILDLIPLPQCIIVVMASKFWRDHVWAQTVTLGEDIGQSLVDAHWLERCAPNLRELTRPYDVHLPALSFPVLKSIKYTHFLFPHWVDAIDQRNLTKLAVRSLGATDPIFAAQFDFPSLQKLYLTNVDNPDLISSTIISHLHRMPNLVKLKMALTTTGPIDQLILALPQLPRLRYFESTYPYTYFITTGDLQKDHQAVWASVLQSSVAFASVLHFTSWHQQNEKPAKVHVLAGSLAADNIEALRFFVAKGVPVDLEVYKTGETVLERALEEKNAAFVAELLQMGANVNHCPHDGRNPLDRSIDTPHTAALLKAGATPRRRPHIFRRFTEASSVIAIAEKFPWTVNQREVVPMIVDGEELSPVLSSLGLAIISNCWEAFDYLWEKSDDATKEHFATSTDARGWNILAYYLRFTPTVKPSDVTKLIKRGANPFVEMLDSTGHKLLLFCRILDVHSLSISVSAGEKNSNLHSAEFTKLFAAVIERFPVLPNFSHLLHNSLIARAVAHKYEPIVSRLLPTLQGSDLSLWAALFNASKLDLSLFCQLITLNGMIKRPEDVKPEDIKVDCSIQPAQVNLIKQGKLPHPVLQLVTGLITEPGVWNLLLRAGLDIFSEWPSTKSRSARAERLMPLGRFLLMSGAPIAQVFEYLPHIDQIQALNLSYLGPNNTTALMAAASASEPSNVRFILAHSTPEQIAAVDADGYNALFYALRHNLQLRTRWFSLPSTSKASVQHQFETARLLRDAGLGFGIQFTEGTKRGFAIPSPMTQSQELNRLIVTAVLPAITASNTTIEELLGLIRGAISADSSEDEIIQLIGLVRQPPQGSSLQFDIPIAPVLKHNPAKAIKILGAIFDHPNFGQPLFAELQPGSALMHLLSLACDGKRVEVVRFIIERIGHVPIESFCHLFDSASSSSNIVAIAALLRAVYVGEDFTPKKLDEAITSGGKQTRLKFKSGISGIANRILGYLRGPSPLTTAVAGTLQAMTGAERRFVEATFPTPNPFISSEQTQLADSPPANAVSFSFPSSNTFTSIASRYEPIPWSSTTPSPESNPFESQSLPTPSFPMSGNPFSSSSKGWSLAGSTVSSSPGESVSPFNPAALSSSKPESSAGAVTSPFSFDSSASSSLAALMPSFGLPPTLPAPAFSIATPPAQLTPSGDAGSVPFVYGEATKGASVPEQSPLNLPPALPFVFGAAATSSPPQAFSFASSTTTASEKLVETPASPSTDLSSLFASLSFASGLALPNTHDGT